MAGFLACPLKAKCEGSELHHLGRRERVWHISGALVVWRLPGAAEVFELHLVVMGVGWGGWLLGGLGFLFVCLFPDLFIKLTWLKC